MVEANNRQGERMGEIMQRLPFLPVTDPERADLQKEYDKLRK
jgi:hypothetical protein